MKSIRLSLLLDLNNIIKLIIKIKNVGFCYHSILILASLRHYMYSSISPGDTSKVSAAFSI